MRPTAIVLAMMTMAAGVPGQEQTSSKEPATFSELRAPLDESTAAQSARSEKPFKYNGNGHVYFATGVCQHGYKHVGVGGGGEAFLWRGLVVGGSAGYHQFVDDGGFGLASLDIGYHFTDRKVPRRFDPFVNISPVGALITGNGFGGAASIGGGANYWFKERVGLRTEVRFQVLAVEEAVVFLRIGVNFR
jgi:hypothetical protein